MSRECMQLLHWVVDVPLSREMIRGLVQPYQCLAEQPKTQEPEAVERKDKIRPTGKFPWFVSLSFLPYFANLVLLRERSHLLKKNCNKIYTLTSLT